MSRFQRSDLGAMVRSPLGVRTRLVAPGGCQFFDGRDYLFMGGGFTVDQDDLRTKNIIAWDGEQFLRMGDGFNGSVNAVRIGGDGRLYAGGDFTASGETPIKGLAVWVCDHWEQVGVGLAANAVGRCVMGITSIAGGILVCGYFMEKGNGGVCRAVAQVIEGTITEVDPGIALTGSASSLVRCATLFTPEAASGAGVLVGGQGYTTDGDFNGLVNACGFNPLDGSGFAKVLDSVQFGLGRERCPFSDVQTQIMRDAGSLNADGSGEYEAIPYILGNNVRKYNASGGTSELLAIGLVKSLGGALYQVIDGETLAGSTTAQFYRTLAYGAFTSIRNVGGSTKEEADGVARISGGDDPESGLVFDKLPDYPWRLETGGKSTIMAVDAFDTVYVAQNFGGIGAVPRFSRLESGTWTSLDDAFGTSPSGFGVRDFDYGRPTNNSTPGALLAGCGCGEES